jgi:predicted nucleotidyltransferase
LSDLDICVITKKHSKKITEKIMYFKDDKLDLAIFDELGLPLQYKIMTEGKILQSKQEITSIKKSIRKEWNDFKPLLNRIYIKKGLLPII